MTPQMTAARGTLGDGPIDPPERLDMDQTRDLTDDLPGGWEPPGSSDDAAEAWLAQLHGTDLPAGPAVSLPPPEPPHTDVDLVLALDPRTLWLDGRPDLAHTRLQLDRAMAYAAARAAQRDQGKVCARAAVIAAAPPGAPVSEAELGLRHAPAGLTGQRVRCRICAASWMCLGGDYWDGTTAADGLCFGCTLADSRTDLDNPPGVITGKITATRRRKTRKTAAAAAGIGDQCQADSS